MIKPFDSSLLPDGGLLIACSSHEERCEGLCRQKGFWHPNSVILFQYDDENPGREIRHKTLVQTFTSKTCQPISLPFVERDPASSLQDNMRTLDIALSNTGTDPVLLDISVFTKRHLLMTLRWLDDRDCWDRLWIIYSEPGDYLVSQYIPLSFGLSRIHQVPGFCATPDMSRPLHLAVFLGYEGDRALAAYELIQPMEATLIVPHPPYRPEWEGRTEAFNREIIKLVGERSIIRVDAIDPMSTVEGLKACLGAEDIRAPHCKVVCPLGTKPQTVGVYIYARACIDPPALVYASPLRHNHNFYSCNIGKSWFLKIPS